MQKKSDSFCLPTLKLITKMQTRKNSSGTLLADEKISFDN